VIYLAYLLGAGVAVWLLMKILNWLSYNLIKERVLQQRKWDLNICCGRTDGGGINADVVKHANLPNFHHIRDIYNLPYADKQFVHVLCSHTLEHVDDPERFYRELRRIGRHITLILPPLWDLSAAFNLLEHKWLFWILRPTHRVLPKYTPLPLAAKVQRLLGQRMHA